MSLESATTIAQLVATNPTPTDPKSQGDDHLRLIKSVLQNSFPAFDAPTTQKPGQIKPDTVTFGDSPTPANNFTLDASADNGTMKLARGNAGATTQDIMTVDAAGKPRFNQLAQLMAENGYKVLEGGLIIQWGRVSVAGTLDITFPIPFPNAFFSATCAGNQATGFAYLTAFVSLTNAGGQLNCIKPDGSEVTAVCSWVAIGY